MKTLAEVEAQRVRFNQLMRDTNLLKLGKKILTYGIYSAESFTLIRKYLGMHGIKSAMYYPGKDLFYGDILLTRAITEYVDSF